jgi:hypothetical protein
VGVSSATPNLAGAFVTSRRGSIDAYEIEFIQTRVRAGTSAANIARMLGRPIDDVRPWMVGDNPPAREMPKIRTPYVRSKVVLSLWRGLIAQPAVARDRAPSMKEIAESVSWRYGVPMEDLRGPSRLKAFALARQAAMYEMVVEDRWSLPQIGLYFDRDHTTVLHGYRRHAQRLAAA